jgi:DNA-binding response OmpR family regulator
LPSDYTGAALGRPAAGAEGLPARRESVIIKSIDVWRPGSGCRPAISEVFRTVSRQHILVVDDDEALRRLLAFQLESAGYRVTCAATAEEALHLAGPLPPDLVLLDIGLPGMDGLTALHHFRRRNAPVIFVTGRQGDMDEVLGLELGADDFISKPFDLNVLLARVKAVLRRAGAEPAAGTGLPLVVGDMVIDPAAHSVSVAGRPVHLSPRQFALLHILARQPRHVIPADELLSCVWGAEYAGEPQVLYVHVRWLREKLEEDPAHPRRIITLRGAGYKLEPCEAAANLA